MVASLRGDTTVDDCASALRWHRRARWCLRYVLLAIAAAAASFIVFALLGVDISILGDRGRALLGWVFRALIAAMALFSVLVVLFRCPVCGNRFYMVDGRWDGAFSRKCRTCGLDIHEC